MQSKGWDLSFRYKTLQALQAKIYAFVDEQEEDPGLEASYTLHTCQCFWRLIKCPHCGHENRVYHFSWCAVTCQGCKRMVDKYDFTTPTK